MKLYSYLYILLLCLLGISCSGQTDDDTTSTGTIVLHVSTTSIVANGTDSVKFVVQAGNDDATARASIRCITNGTTITKAAFATTKAGTYKFEATLNGQTSAPIEVTATEAPAVESKYVRNICVAEMTGTWCSFCPEGYRNLTYVIDNKGYKDVAYLMAFHGEDGDPMEIPQTEQLKTKFKLDAFPQCVVDMRQGLSLQSGAGLFSSIQGALDASLNTYPAHCGVALQSDYDATNHTATVTVKVASEKSEEYRVALYVLEDGIVYRQNNAGIYIEDYTHNHVVRKLYSIGMEGDQLGNIAAGKEAIKTYTAAFDSSWKADNLTFYALVFDNSGYVNNMAACKAVNGKTDYQLLSK